MWAGDGRPYTGKHYQLVEPLNVPQPLSRPHPPIVIGGDGEKKTLRLVAAYADACNFVINSPSSLEEFGELRATSHSRAAVYRDLRDWLGRKLSVLEQHCHAVGRPYDAIEKTIVTYIKLGPGAMDAGSVIDLCRELSDLGFHHVIFNMPNVHEIAPLELLGREVIPVVAEFG
jgi:alkanesulfonate monooxygenase SsuD/methylene tetrahydromethanopterin reductase-like flavin-dependent oxidoreductase (luciferase family)